MTDLAKQRVTLGLWLLCAVVAIRWLSASALGEWSMHVRREIRTHWRNTLPTHLALPRLEHERARGDLALAIDHASEAPFLEVLSTSARVSVLGLVIVFWAAGWLALLITILLLVSAVPLYLRAGRRSEAMAAEFQARRSVLESRQLELLTHAPELRALGAVPYGANEIAAISDSEHAIALRAIRIALESSLVTEFLSGVSIGLVAMVVGFALLGGRISLSHALVAVLVTSEVFLQVRRFGTEFHRRENAVRSLALLHEVSGRSVSGELGDLLVSDQVVTSVNDQPVSIRLQEGERLLVRGPSGSGKTTLLETWLGWTPAKDGTIRRTSRPIGFVSVASSLVSGTLRENLILDAEIPDARVQQMLEALGLTGQRFVDLDVRLLADGQGMSTGERVRLVLARALLAGPALLILDDIAGVLDAEARSRVRQTLDTFHQVTIIEATVDDPVLASFDSLVEVPR
jgi:ABC-type transport system involved in cytochrome bd biosynthesis fused ATPase/permease subunit